MNDYDASSVHLKTTNWTQTLYNHQGSYVKGNRKPGRDPQMTSNHLEVSDQLLHFPTLAPAYLTLFTIPVVTSPFAD